jgi:predicted amidophosphoribosyltransferase
MRNRHFPRLCRACQAPMARQDDLCWRCGVHWASQGVPRPALRAVAGEPLAWPAARAAADAERWMNEGGSIGSEAPAPLRAIAARG